MSLSQSIMFALTMLPNNEKKNSSLTHTLSSAKTSSSDDVQIVHMPTHSPHQIVSGHVFQHPLSLLNDAVSRQLDAHIKRWSVTTTYRVSWYVMLINKHHCGNSHKCDSNSTMAISVGRWGNSTHPRSMFDWACRKKKIWLPLHQHWLLEWLLDNCLIIFRIKLKSRRDRIVAELFLTLVKKPK